MLLGAAIVGGYLYARNSVGSRPQLIAETLCPTDGPRGMTVILLDTTDDLPAVTKREVQTILVGAAEKLPDYHLLEVRQLDPAAPSGTLLFQKCNPGDGANLSEVTGNPVIARKKWLEQFRKPVGGALDKGLSSNNADSSPLIETLQWIAVDRLSDPVLVDKPKRLIVISDMLQHSDNYSHYNGDLSYLRFKDSAAYRGLKTDLHNADVTIEYVQRTLKRPLNTGDHIQFWSDWVQDNGGHLVEAVKLQGAG